MGEERTGGNGTCPECGYEPTEDRFWPVEVAGLAELVRDLTDPDDCHFDHHGYCQAHGWLTDERPCPHGRAKNFLSAINFLVGER